MARRPRRTRRPVKPFDTTTKYLFELDPAAWLAYAGLPERGTVQLLDTDVSTVVAQVDKVVRVGDPGSWLAHFEFQSSREPQFVARPSTTLSCTTAIRRWSRVLWCSCDPRLTGPS